MIGPTYSIRNWSDQFENCASRKLRTLNWVPIPNGHDSTAYCRLMSRKDGPEIFTAWILLVQLASRCHERGVLASNDGRPYQACEIALKTRAPERIFINSLPELISMGWVESDGAAGESAGASGESADTSGGRGRLAAAKGREGKGTEGNGTEGKTPLTPQDKLGGDLPDNLNYDSFIKVWMEWEQHRKEIRKPLKPTQVKKQLKRLGELGLKKAITALNHTIDMGWQGIREPEPDDPRKPRPKPGNNSTESILKELERETDAL